MTDAPPLSFYELSPIRRIPGAYPLEEFEEYDMPIEAVYIIEDEDEDDQSPDDQLREELRASQQGQAFENTSVGLSTKQHTEPPKTPVMAKPETPEKVRKERELMRLALQCRRPGDPSPALNHFKWKASKHITESETGKELNECFGAPDPGLLFGRRFAQAKVSAAKPLPSIALAPAQSTVATPHIVALQPAAAQPIPAPQPIAATQPVATSHPIATAQSTTLTNPPIAAPALSGPVPVRISARTKTQKEVRPRTTPHAKKPTKKPTKKATLDDILVGTEESEKENIELLPPSDKKTKERARQAEERKQREEQEKLREAQEKREAAKQARLSRRNPNKKLVQPLTAEWDAKVDDALHLKAGDRAADKVLTTTPARTPIHVADFQKLLGRGQWLNDEVINGYIEWIVDAANKAAVAEAKSFGEKPSTIPKFIGQLSFFYTTVCQKGPEATARLMKRHKAVGADFLEVDTMFVPVCSGMHWTLGVVRPVAKTIEYFDSMGGKGHVFVGHMRKWLKFQLGKDYVADEWTVPHTGCAVQNNGYDCGVFVCTNALCIALGINTSCYLEKDMVLQRRLIAATLLNKGFTGDFMWADGY